MASYSGWPRKSSRACARRRSFSPVALVNGSQILARTLRRLQLDTFFYIMGGPMLAAEAACVEEGLRAIDVRHEQAAAMMAHAFGRVKNTLGVCMAASGPGATNLVTGVANAW